MFQMTGLGFPGKNDLNADPKVDEQKTGYGGGGRILDTLGTGLQFMGVYVGGKEAELGN